MNTESKHTQGEWELSSRYSPNQDDYREIRCNDTLIARVYNEHWVDISKEEAHANAKLIAASPELLEACNWAIAQFKRLADEGRYPEFMLQNNNGEGIMPLVNAINKATL